MDGFIYQYTVGGVVFGAGLYFAARQGYIGLSGRRLVNLLILLVGLMFFMALQGYLQYAPMETAPEVPYKGGFERKAILGQPIDYGIIVLYFLAILAIGTYFGRNLKTTKDFFFGGQRFSWWLITFSLVATTVGSYSFVKYSRVAYDYGLSSSQTYLNDWLWIPLLIFGWLPILYFSRVTSVPEYFERRFSRGVRNMATLLILVYLIGYVGVNLFTMGKAIKALLGVNILYAAIVVAAVSAFYVTLGGQTSVIMTDLFQGIMLLGIGVLIFILGFGYLGGFEGFWENLPRAHRHAFANFNSDPSFPSVGIFWQDAMANSAMFYFLHQGMIMRFMAAKSANEARKAMIVLALVLMPIAACVVASGGWVGKALVHAGVLPPDLRADEAFYITAEFLSRPGVFGLIMAALTAALMSTIDTLITAVAAIVVNDVYKPYFRPQATDRQLLGAARMSAVSVTLLGVALVPVFMQFGTIYEAHGAFTAAVTPPLVVTLLLSVFWRRFTRPAALLTLTGGIAAMVFSMFVPEVIRPFAQGVPMKEVEASFFSGFKQYKFMRACYGLSVCSVIAVVTTLLTRPETFERSRGLVWGTVKDALRHYKGTAGEERPARRAAAIPQMVEGEEEYQGAANLPVVQVSTALAEALDAKSGDLVYLTDRRRWLGGLYSAHAIISEIVEGADPTVFIRSETYSSVVSPNRADMPITVDRLY